MLFIIIIIIYCMNLEVINQPACDVVDPYLQKTYCKARYAWRWILGVMLKEQVM